MEIYTAKQVLSHWEQHNFPGRIKTKEVIEAERVVQEAENAKVPEDKFAAFKEARAKEREAELSRCIVYEAKAHESSKALKSEKMLCAEETEYLRNLYLKIEKFWKNKHKQVAKSK